MQEPCASTFRPMPPTGNPAPLAVDQFQARYWRAFGKRPFPLLPLTLADGESLAEQKLSNNLTALAAHLKHTEQALHTEQEHLRQLETGFHTHLRRLEWLLCLAFALLCLLMIAIGLLWRQMP